MNRRPARSAEDRRDPPRERQEAPAQNQRPAERSAGGQPRQSGVFSRLRDQERPRVAGDLRDVLNDRRERNGDNIPAPAQRPEVVPTEVQAQLDNLKKELEKLTGDKPSFID